MLRREKLYFLFSELIILFITLILCDLDYVYFFLDISIVHIFMYTHTRSRIFIHMCIIFERRSLYYYYDMSYVNLNEIFEILIRTRQVYIFFTSSCADRKLSCKCVRLRLYLKTMIHTLKTLNQNIKSL